MSLQARPIAESGLFFPMVYCTYSNYPLAASPAGAPVTLRTPPSFRFMAVLSYKQPTLQNSRDPEVGELSPIGLRSKQKSYRRR